MVPADSRRIPRAPRYSGYHWASDSLKYGAVTLCGAAFQLLPLAIFLAVTWSYNPHEAGTSWVWALPRSLATTYGIIVYFLFLRVLRCFSSPRSPPHISGYQAFSLMGCPIRKSPGQWIFAPCRGLSQLITSFIACESLGIRHTPFPTFARTAANDKYANCRRLTILSALFFAFACVSCPICQRSRHAEAACKWNSRS